MSVISLALSLGAAQALAVAPPRFPAPAPQEGSTLGCPTVDVLSRRFPTQSDGNHGGYGYYMASWSDTGVPSIAEPSEDFLQRLAAGQLSGRAMSEDDKLRTLWGLHCAYPRVDAVTRTLETTRAAYTAATGVSPATEERLHKLAIDTVAWDQQRRDVCGSGKPWPADDEAGFLLKGVCGGFHDDVLAGYAFRHIDHGDASPVYGGAVVGMCGEVLTGDGEGNPTGGEYFLWRQCAAEPVDEAALTATLAAKAANPVAAALWQAWYERGRARIAAWREPMAAREQETPALRTAWDDAVARVSQVWHPALQRWRGDLDAIDAWMTTVSKNPSDPGSCDADLAPRLQAYVDAAAPGAKGEAVLAVLKDPIGYRFTEALALCYHLKGQRALSTMWRDLLLADGLRIEGEHQGLQTLLVNNAGYGSYNGQPLPLTAPGHGLVLAQMEESWSRRTLGSPTPPDQLRQLNSYGTEKIAGVSVSGDVATLTFVHHTATFDELVGCQTDYSKPLRIDEWGYIIYADKGCRRENVTVDDTQVPSHVPAWQVKGLKAGDTVIIQRRGDPTPPDLSLAWIKRGADIVWAAGATVH